MFLYVRRNWPLDKRAEWCLKLSFVRSIWLGACRALLKYCCCHDEFQVCKQKKIPSPCARCETCQLPPQWCYVTRDYCEAPRRYERSFRESDSNCELLSKVCFARCSYPEDSWLGSITRTDASLRSQLISTKRWMSFLIEVEDHSNQTVVGFLLVYCSADNLLQISPGFQGLYVCFLCHFVEQDHCRWDCSGSVLGLRGCQPSQSVLCKQYNDRIPNVLADFDCHHSNCQMPNSWRLVLNLLVHVLRFWTWNAYSGMCELGVGPCLVVLICHLRLWNFSGFASAAIIRLWKRALLSRQRDKRGTRSTLPVVLKQIKSLQGFCFLLYCMSESRVMCVVRYW